MMGAPHAARRLILHADDFGMSRAVTDGIVKGFTHGLLTSTSLLANAPDAERALLVWRRMSDAHREGTLPTAGARSKFETGSPPFDLGIHFNLTQGFPLTGNRYPTALRDKHGRFCGIGSLFGRLQRGRARFTAAISAELSAQIEFLLDHGFIPTHVNGHQYIELIPSVRQVVLGLLDKYRVGSIRLAKEPAVLQTTLLQGEFANAGLALVKRFYATEFQKLLAKRSIASADAYFGTSHAGRIDLPLMRGFLNHNRFSVVEIGVHPARPCTESELAPSNAGWDDPLAELRPLELELLCSAEFAQLLAEANVLLGRLGEESRVAIRGAA